MRIKVMCDGPMHAHEPERFKALGVWVDMHSFKRDLSARGFVYELTPMCPLECPGTYLRIEILS